jgi:hypothetical protein
MNCVYRYHMVQIVCSTEKKEFSVVSDVTDLRKQNYPDRYLLGTLAYDLFILHE